MTVTICSVMVTSQGNTCRDQGKLISTEDKTIYKY